MSAPGETGITLRGAGYRYPTGGAPACADVDLDVRPGELVLVTGPTGCGKSTLLRLAAGLLQRHGAGDVLGTVTVAGLDPATTRPSERVSALGLVGQEPADQLVASTIADEIAFAMESAGLSAAQIDARLPGLLETVGLDAVGVDLPLDRDPRSLSGGQTQRLVTAAALAAGAGALVLDEPVAQLDPSGARALLLALRRVADRGVAVLLVEHRLELCWPVADRIVVMADGRVVDQAVVAQIQAGHPMLATLRRLGLRVPGLLDLADRLGVGEAQLPRLLSGLEPVQGAAAPPGGELLSLSLPAFRYAKASPVALHPVHLVLRRGERLALLGANGAGKSTLLRLLAGTLRAPGLRAPADLVAVPQDPDLALFCPTVRQELAYGPRERGQSELDQAVTQAATALSVGDLLDRAPQALSRGQRLRVAVAAALSCRPGILVLDEPTSGQDHDQVEAMLRSLAQALSQGALVFATHDIDLALRHATRVMVLHQGRIVADAAPALALCGLPAAVPIELPPLSRLCLDQGQPPATAASLALRLSTPLPTHTVSS